MSLTIGERRHRFGRHDRIVISGAFYRVERKVRDQHLLQLVVDGVAQNQWLNRTDKQVNALMRSGKFRLDRDHYSKAATLLRMRVDDSDVYDLDDARLRTVSWKTEWVDRFHQAQIDTEARWRPTRGLLDIEEWVAENKDAMDRWYLDRFGERRRPGRRRAGEERKEFDWPGASTLRGWLIKYEEEGCRMEAFRPQYHKCGNRNQLNPRTAEIIRFGARTYAGSNNPTKMDVVEHVEALIHAENQNRPESDQLSAGDKAIRRRIDLVDPLLRNLGRKGRSRALQIHAPVGKGQRDHRALERVEMDDWEFDLFALLKRSNVWKELTREQRALVPRVRCTVTAAVDVATRCVVGLFISPLAPSTSGSRFALRTTMVDKTLWAKQSGCRGDWPMHGGIQFIVTDGGPAFQGEFEDAVRATVAGRRRPNQDKIMRGYVESFFKTLQRICAYFAGRTFSNVVKLGDYNASANASMVFADLRNALIRFVVDIYHHRPHRGLEGLTPYEAWERRNAKEGIAPGPSDRQVRLAFAFPRDYAIDQHGVTVGKFSYNSEKLSVLRAVMNGTKVAVRIDPFDLGVATVTVPARYRQRFIDHANAIGIPLDETDEKYLDVASVDPLAAGTQLQTVIAESKKVKALVKEASEAGKAIRYAGILELIETGENARRDAGLATFVPTGKEFDQLVGLLHQRSRGALSSVAHAETPVDPDSEDDVGEVVATTVRTAPRRLPAPARTAGTDEGATSAPKRPQPFGGSLNMDEGDDE